MVLKKLLLVFLFSTLSLLQADDIFNIENALQKAQRVNKPVYYVVANAGCSHCVNYLQNTIRPNFDEINRNFVFALSDLSKGDRIPQNLPFDGTTPTTYILAPNGQMMSNPIKGDFSTYYFRKLVDRLYQSFGH